MCEQAQSAQWERITRCDATHGQDGCHLAVRELRDAQYGDYHVGDKSSLRIPSILAFLLLIKNAVSDCMVLGVSLVRVREAPECRDVFLYIL